MIGASARANAQDAALINRADDVTGQSGRGTPRVSMTSASEIRR
jgi:hypothetical protein